jgi:hypothetical protein
MTTPRPHHGTVQDQLDALDRAVLETNARMDSLFASFRAVLETAGLPVPACIPAPAPPPQPDPEPATARVYEFPGRPA